MARVNKVDLQLSLQKCCFYRFFGGFLDLAFGSLGQAISFDLHKLAPLYDLLETREAILCSKLSKLPGFLVVHIKRSRDVALVLHQQLTSSWQLKHQLRSGSDSSLQFCLLFEQKPDTFIHRHALQVQRILGYWLKLLLRLHGWKLALEVQRIVDV